MNWIFIGFFLPTFALYVYYSRREGSYLNALTGLTFLKCCTEFALEPIAFNLGIFDYRVTTFFQLYLASFVAFAALIFGARRLKCRQPAILHQNIVPTLMPWIFFVLAILVYLPILIEFRDSIFNPRYIYEKTRTGYGAQFFGSALLANCSLILFLLSKRRFHFFFTLLLISFTLLKGSKGQLLTIILIYGIWSVYVLRKRFDVKRTLTLVVVVSAIMSAVFVFNFRGQIDSLLITMAGYSDYNRNASLILEDQGGKIYFGRLSFENFAYSKIPRSLWTEKPKNYGAFFLAENYFPKLFEIDSGAPSFGIGIYFADFGVLAYCFIAGVYYFTGRMLRHFIQSFESRASVLSFIMVLFFADISILPVGVGYFILEYLTLATLLQKLVIGFRMSPRDVSRQKNILPVLHDS